MSLFCHCVYFLCLFSSVRKLRLSAFNKTSCLIHSIVLRYKKSDCFILLLGSRAITHSNTPWLVAITSVTHKWHEVAAFEQKCLVWNPPSDSIENEWHELTSMSGNEFTTLIYWTGVTALAFSSYLRYCLMERGSTRLSMVAERFSTWRPNSDCLMLSLDRFMRDRGPASSPFRYRRVISQWPHTALTIRCTFRPRSPTNEQVK